MNTDTHPKTAFYIQVLTRNQTIYLHIKIPLRWLLIMAAMLGAVITSTPLSQLIEFLAPLIK